MKRLLNFIKSIFGNDEPKIQKQEPITKSFTLPQRAHLPAVKRTHNNLKRTTGRKIQVIQVVKKPSHFFDMPQFDGEKSVPVWVSAKFKTKVIFH
jgi:hypothetical protein